VEFAKENRRREPNMDRSYVAVLKAAVGDSLHRDPDDSCSRRPPGIQLLVTGLGRDVSWQVRTASFRLLPNTPNAGCDPIHGRGCADAFLRINFFTSWTERRTKILNGWTGSNYLSAHRGPIGPIYLPVGAPRIAEILRRRAVQARSRKIHK
jgi:hypothetical protein